MPKVKTITDKKTEMRVVKLRLPLAVYEVLAEAAKAQGLSMPTYLRMLVWQHQQGGRQSVAMRAGMKIVNSNDKTTAKMTDLF